MAFAKSYGNNDSDEYKNALEASVDLKGQISGAIHTFSELKESILDGLDVTAKYIKAKRELSKVMELIIAEFVNSVNILNQIEA